jgi:hypothetical protein
MSTGNVAFSCLDWLGAYRDGKKRDNECSKLFQSMYITGNEENIQNIFVFSSWMCMA